MPLLNLPNKLPSVSYARELTSVICNPRKPIIFKPTVLLPLNKYAVAPDAKLTINAFNGNTTNFAR